MSSRATFCPCGEKQCAVSSTLSRKSKSRFVSASKGQRPARLRKQGLMAGSLVGGDILRIVEKLEDDSEAEVKALFVTAEPSSHKVGVGKYRGAAFLQTEGEKVCLVRRQLWSLLFETLHLGLGELPTKLS